MQTSEKLALITLSQFHYGSIQIEIQDFVQFAKDKSQFHYGSIQMSTRSTNLMQLQVRLNSTMVRFKFSYWEGEMFR